ncbi:LysR substrate-binding domain-containing protein [Sabulicella glaciei]|uniref:LysR substrate-binding domain-containing protein n=1 Tax=Sabulicella glaciei TaxID=2984948 RepID=A0ABT3NTQ2_9PROT|nr:LysR substrate-binding domain-containing protein [Roseococcus sp. MDT2-1-1]MCW8085544.1 LysR substrate-binding domain-containing protein [Roseococcus sp. MDT2-1-1]
MNLAGLSLRDLEYVSAVAEHRHFGRAAAACGVSQPTLSGQLRKLEEFLSLEIFERSPRGVLVTARGEEVVAQARRILSEARRLFEVVRTGAEPLTGVVRLGVISTLGPYLVPFLLRPLRARFPRLRLLLIEGNTRPLIRQLEQGELDAVLAAGPLGESDLAELPLFREELALAVPRDHALAQVDEVRPGDIPASELILLSEGHCLRDQALAFCPDRLREGDHVLQAASLESLRQMIAAGSGVSLFPQLAIQVGALLDDMVAYRRIAGGAFGRDVALFHRPSFGRIRDIRMLRQAIGEILAEQSAVRVHRPGIRLAS